MRYYITQGPVNPFARAIAGVFAAITIIVAMFFGMIILAVVAGVIAILALVFWVRAAWLRRSMSRNASGPEAGPVRSQQSGEFIEAEYTVVSEKRD